MKRRQKNLIIRLRKKSKIIEADYSGTKIIKNNRSSSLPCGRELFYNSAIHIDMQ